MVECKMGEQQRIQAAGPAAKEKDAIPLGSHSLVQSGVDSSRIFVYLQTYDLSASGLCCLLLYGLLEWSIACTQSSSCIALCTSKRLL